MSCAMVSGSSRCFLIVHDEPGSDASVLKVAATLCTSGVIPSRSGLDALTGLPTLAASWRTISRGMSSSVNLMLVSNVA